MRNWIRFSWVACAITHVLAATPTQTSTEGVSLAPNGTPADGNCFLWSQAVSADGRFVAYWSGAANLTSNPPPALHCYIRDRQSGTTSVIDQTAGGSIGSGSAKSPAITPDGRFVVFTSKATELVPTNNNIFDDVFIKDMTTGAIERLSDAWDRSAGNEDSGGATVSADGRIIAFTSTASNLVPGDTNQRLDIFVHDRSTGQTERINLGPNGEQADEDSTLPYVSADGRYVAYQSQASNLGSHGGLLADVLVYDRITGKTEPAGIDYETSHPAAWGSERAALSADGRFVTFHSSSDRLVPNDTNGRDDVFVRDLVLGVTTRISVSESGMEGNSGSSRASISADGRYVSFWSAASNLVPGDVNGVRDAFVHDRQLGTMRLVSVSTSGVQGNDWSQVCVLSSDGSFLAFESDATNLAAEMSTSQNQQIFLRVSPPAGPSTYCLSQTSSSGCLGSISGTGIPSATAGSGFDVGAMGLANQKFGLLAYSTTASTLKPFGGSFLCIAAPLRRTPAQTSGGSPSGAHDCTGSFSLDFNAHAASGKDPALVPGQTVWAQYWSRDPGAPANTNLTDAITFLLGT